MKQSFFPLERFIESAVRKSVFEFVLYTVTRKNKCRCLRAFVKAVYGE